MTMIPKLAGMADLQRRAGKVMEPIKNGSEDLIFLTDHNDIFGVTMSLEYYQQLIQAAKSLENDFWNATSETSMDFWKHKSNDIYETL